MFWKDSNNQICDDMDGQALSLPSWPQGMTQITPLEADAILHPPLTPQQQRDAIDVQITQLEFTQLMSRITRESLLTMAVEKAIALGMTELQLYKVQIGYHKLKDFDNSIAALREQRNAL